MPTWNELDRQFSALQTALRDARLDIQWGDAGEYLRLAAVSPGSVQSRFRAIAAAAGHALRQMPPGTVPDETIQGTDDEAVWYRALWHMSDRLEHRPPVQMLGPDRQPSGMIFSATIYQVADASATLCLRLATASEAFAPPLPVAAVAPRRLAVFWEKYAVPIVVGTIATIVGGAVLAFLL